MSRQLGALLVAVCLPSTVRGQIGVTYCTCQPSVYTFTFNFSAECDVGTIDGSGVRGADCFARGIGLGSEDTNLTTPVQVTSISILELDRSLRVAAQSPYVADFRDGDSFTYTSIVADPTAIDNLAEDEIPGGIQLDMVGINALEQPITNVWIILFDNDCGIFPVLEIGDQIGWTILSDLRPPLDTFCPIARTESPTSSPASPSKSPTRNPSKVPSTEPTKTPMTATKALVAGPTITPATRQPMMMPTTAEPTVCITYDDVRQRGGNGGSGSDRSDSSSTKRNDKNGDGKGTGSSQRGKAGRVNVHDTTTREDEPEARFRYSKRHHFYFYGQQSVSARGIGQVSRPVAAPSKSPTVRPLVDCKDRNFYPDKIAKSPIDSRGPKLTKVSTGIARRPRPASDFHGPKLQKPSQQPIQWQTPVKHGTEKGPVAPTTTKLATILAEMLTRQPASKGKSNKPEDSKEASYAPSPSLFESNNSGHSKISAPNDTTADGNEQPSPKEMKSGKGNNKGSIPESITVPSRAPLVVPIKSSAIREGDAEAENSGDGTGFGVIGDGRSDDDDAKKEEKEDVDSKFGNGNVNDDNLPPAEESPDPPGPSPEYILSSPQRPTNGKGKRISPASTSGANDMDNAKRSKKGSDHHRVQRTLRRLPVE